MVDTLAAPEVPALEDRVVRSAIDDASWSLEGFVAGLPARADYGVFDAPVVAFCRSLSSALLASRADPAVVALGYWLRPASIERMRAGLLEGAPARQVIVPRGLAFHVTPANVDTVFVYSWVLSLLAGNANVVRVSSRWTDTRTRLIAAIASALGDPEAEPIRASNRIIVTERDDRVAGALSLAADVRVIWGGDATVERFRRLPIRPHARDLVFPDRHSLAILDAERVADLDEGDLDRLADAFFNDAYAFDQGACSSPRLLVWRALAQVDERVVDRARRRFHEAVGAAIARRVYVTETGMAIAKVALALERAASVDGAAIERASNEATWVRLPDLGAYDRDTCGGGIFFEVVTTDLRADLRRFSGARDQTVAVFGIDADEVRDLARDLAGRGVDRFVRFGRALEFESSWDGMDLLRELTKRVVVDV